MRERSKIDWRKLAQSAYEAWTKDAVDLPNVMAELGACLKEEPDCPAVHQYRPMATCSLPRGHKSRHYWTQTADCRHPATKTVQGGERTYHVCLACGSFVEPPMPAVSEEKKEKTP